jgi:hypothetical protein
MAKATSVDLTTMRTSIPRIAGGDITGGLKQLLSPWTRLDRGGKRFEDISNPY